MFNLLDFSLNGGKVKEEKNKWLEINILVVYGLFFGEVWSWSGSVLIESCFFGFRE